MLVKANGEGLPVQAWEVYYKDGSIYTSKNHSWEDIPVDGVLGVIWWHGLHAKGIRKKTLSTGMDYYFYKNSHLWGDTNDFEEVKEGSYKRGIWTTDEHYEEIRRKMFEKLDIDG